MINPVEEIKRLLKQCTPEQRQEVFRILRQECSIHPFELQLNTTAEVILEAFSKANDLTIRGIRGIIAEATFVVNVVNGLAGWEDKTPKGDLPFDCLLSDGKGDVRVQIKMQRLKNQKPMFASQGRAGLPADSYVVETQRTRGGKDSTGSSTRPYKFGEFDILGVCLHPSTRCWTDFLFTVGNWLIPDPDNSSLIFKYQPVPPKENDLWTGDFLKCVEWFRTGIKKRIWNGEIKSSKKSNRKKSS